MTGLFRRAMLAVSLSAVLAGTGVAAAAAVHADARALPPPGGMGVPGPSSVRTLLRPGRPDWYVLPGGPAHAVDVRIDTISVPAGCSSQQTPTPSFPVRSTLAEPFQVSLYNPEGHWIGPVPPGVPPDNDLYLLAAAYPGRYLVAVAIVDPACGGLQYRIRNAFVGCGPKTSCVGAIVIHHADAATCASLRANVSGATRRWQAARAGRHPDARQVRKRLGELAAAQRGYRNRCASHA